MIRAADICLTSTTLSGLRKKLRHDHARDGATQAIGGLRAR